MNFSGSESCQETNFLSVLASEKPLIFKPRSDSDDGPTELLTSWCLCSRTNPPFWTVHQFLTQLRLSIF